MRIKLKSALLFTTFCFLILSPAYAADYVISSNTNWADQADVPADINNLTVDSGITLTIGATGTYESAGITVTVSNDLAVNGTIACQGEYTNDTNGVSVTLEVSNDCTVAGTGKIHADYLGYRYGDGPGASPATSDESCGGSYGGLAGRGKNSTDIQPVYGSITNPADLGSGGNDYVNSGPGGGAIKLNIANLLTLDGAVSANGQTNIGIYGGGGSGGSVWIITKNITGTGTVTAIGGNGYTTAGGGGGGRISITGYTNYTFSGWLSVADGSGYTNFPVMLAHPGTVHFDDWSAFPSTISTGCIGLAAGGTYNINHDLTITNAAKLYIRGSSSITVSNFVLQGAGTNLWLVGDTNANLGVTVNAQNLTIGTGIVISADYLGYLRGTGPGASSFTGDEACGGTYGGKGGRGRNSPDIQPVYGSVTNPVNLGSGGNNHVASGAGGGAIKFNITNLLTLNGTVSANGQTYTAAWGAGGSGGSIWIIAKNITGIGTVTANGGNGDNTAGGGGGGRIAITGYTNYSFSGSLSVADGGSSYTNFPRMVARPGTVYLENWSDLPSVINAGGIGLASGGTYNVNHDLTITNGGRLYIRSNSSITVSNMLIINGARLTISGNSSITVSDLVLQGTDSKLLLEGDTNANAGVTVNAQNLTLGTGTVITADHLGYIYGQGPGASADTTDEGPGASYGGPGGIGNTSDDVQPVYGSATAPVDLGSGGNNYMYSGTGGGAIKLNIANLFTLNGAISANGQTYTATYGSGGSGGSIWIITKNITGIGTITANAGNGQALSGGGGGGRIAISTQSDNFTQETPGTYTNYSGSTNGLINVDGGTGFAAGTNGTFHLEIIPAPVGLFLIR